VEADSGFVQGYVTAQDGLRLAFRDYGREHGAARTPLVCLPGLMRNGADFHRVAGRLSERRRVIALDLRGRGRSDYDPTGKSYNPWVYLGDIKQVLIALDLPPAVFCGTSLGAFLTMGLSAVAPTALAGAILNDASPDVDPEAISDISERVGELGSDLPASWDEAVPHLKKLLPKARFRSEDDWVRMARGTYREDSDGRLVADWDPAVAGTLGGDVPGEQLWRLFGALRSFPLLVVRGGQSAFVKDKTLSRMQAMHHDMKVLTVEDAGHAPSLFEEESQAAMDSFLDGIDDD